MREGGLPFHLLFDRLEDFLLLNFQYDLFLSFDVGCLLQFLSKLGERVDWLSDPLSEVQHNDADNNEQEAT